MFFRRGCNSYKQQILSTRLRLQNRSRCFDSSSSGYLYTYPHHVHIQTRWNDRDAFGHINNVHYYQYVHVRSGEPHSSALPLPLSHWATFIPLVMYIDLKCHWFLSLSLNELYNECPFPVVSRCSWLRRTLPLVAMHETIQLLHCDYIYGCNTWYRRWSKLVLATSVSTLYSRTYAVAHTCGWSSRCFFQPQCAAHARYMDDAVNTHLIENDVGVDVKRFVISSSCNFLRSLTGDTEVAEFCSLD